MNVTSASMLVSSGVGKPQKKKSTAGKARKSIRKSLANGAALGNKAQEMLGLRNKTKTSFQIQRSGYLMKKPFSKASKNGVRGAWQKRYFVLKDSFLFWYSHRSGAVFDTQPSGCLPLGGCSVFPMGKENDSFVFEVSHPDFDGNLLLLKSNDAKAVDDWIKVLQECSKATWHNAMLGDAHIQKLKHADSELAREKEERLQQAQKAAEEFAEIRQQKLRVMEAQLDAQRQLEAQILEERVTAQKVEEEMSEQNAALERERREQEELRESMLEMEETLLDAQAAIERLEDLLKDRLEQNTRQSTRFPELQNHIETIRSFLDSGKDPSDDAEM
mmetsp:Transcript_21580/g.38119  ORF Transcript_21580/g.38119 Transcript_21580/m.38119 type:complete len:331 (+) Transcript_21580:317-1309(+)